jgi:hypothetical protein
VRRLPTRSRDLRAPPPRGDEAIIDRRCRVTDETREAIRDPVAFARRQKTSHLIAIFSHQVALDRVLPTPQLLRHPHLDSTADGVEAHLARLEACAAAHQAEVNALLYAVAAELDRRIPIP